MNRSFYRIGGLSISLMLLVAGCTQTSIQPMAQDTFLVSTNAAPACGPNGTRNVAFKSAAIEVIRRGGDLFIISQDNTDTSLQGDIFTGMYTNYSQGMVVRLIQPNTPEAANALSARQTLGANWQQIVAEGAPTTCA